MPLILNKHGLKSIVAHMSSKTTHATLTGVDDTLIFYIYKNLCSCCFKETKNKMLLKMHPFCHVQSSKARVMFHFFFWWNGFEKKIYEKYWQIFLWLSRKPEMKYCFKKNIIFVMFKPTKQGECFPKNKHSCWKVMYTITK